MNVSTSRRLPAYGREVRAGLSAGQRPALGNTVAVCIDWPKRCALAKVVCCPRDRAPNEYDFEYLAGIDTIVWFERRDRSYAEAVRVELRAAGSPIIAMLCVPEGFE